MSKKITEKQKGILYFIDDFIKENMFPPTVREIGERFNITVKGAYDHLKSIEKKGFVNCIKGISRGIVVEKKMIIKLRREK